jgi:Protein of unknown function (DUF3999)
MPSDRLARAVAAGLLAASLAAPAAAVEGFLYSREVQVPAAGWVRVPLDLTAVQHLAPGGADLHAFAPGGGEVALRVAPAAQRSERRDVTVVKVEKTEGGWTLLLDAGPDPAPHERLFFAMAHMASAPSVRLDGSADGKAWQALATGDLFRIGESAGLQQIALSYPSTTDRFLRLEWPQEAGFPRVQAVEVETVSGPSVTYTTRGAECQAAGTSSSSGMACSFPLPAPGQVLRRLTVDVEGSGAVGYRLYEPRSGTWRLLREGAWQRSGNRTQHFLAGGREELAGSRLRLELFGAGNAAPRLAGWGIELAVQTVLFRAEEAGRYTLAYGGAVRRNHRLEEPPADADTAWLEAGPEKEQSVPAVSAMREALRTPGAPLGKERFDISWTVIAPSAKPGDLVRLELPDVVYANARRDLGDLRVALGQSQIPFFRWTPPEPAPAGGQPLHPGPVHRPGESESEVTLPASGLPLTELVLTAPGGPLRRTVGVRYLEPVRRLRRLPQDPMGDPREQPPVTRTLWQCDPEPPLPCREALELPGAAPKLLSVRLDDGDNPPLAGLDAAVWRRRDVLLFVWPKSGKGEAVKLMAGSERLTAPAYDFATLGEVLLARPWQTAELDLTGTATAQPSRWARWALPIALTLAGLFLLLLLRRILAEH